MDVKKVLIVLNYSRRDAIADAMLLETYLLGLGVKTILAPQDGEDTILFVEGDSDGYDLVISLGGDGTLLQAARIVGESGIPIVGISYGHLGFLTCSEPHELFHTINDALNDRLYPSRRSMLSVEAEFEDSDGLPKRISMMGLNDLSIGHGSHGDILSFEVSVSGNHIDYLRADGFVVSTATGSTGYALSAGGPIVTPEFDGMVCVPVAPHTIMARAFLTGKDDIVELSIDPQRQAETCVFVDGQPLADKRRLVKVSCHIGEKNIILLDRNRKSFYESVSRVFYGKDRK